MTTLANQQLEQLLYRAIAELGLEPNSKVSVVRPERADHLDWSTNAALVLAKASGQNPRELAANLVEAMRRVDKNNLIDNIEIAGPGFVNFAFSDRWYQQRVRDVVTEGREDFGKVDLGQNRTLLLEFVSANPTGPLHIGNGWWASYGDALGRLLKRTGWNVSTEYYVNDTGGQIRTLGKSILAARRGENIPEGGYKGEYVKELAPSYDGPDDVTLAGQWAAERIIDDIKASLETAGVKYDVWFSQASIEESGYVEQVVNILSERGHVYKATQPKNTGKGEGRDKNKDRRTVIADDREAAARATYFESGTETLGDERDRVLRKSELTGGHWTYLAGDIAYHYNKLVERGFDHAIDIFGADHAGQVPSLKASLMALNVDPQRLDILLGSMISIRKGSEERKQSKRKGDIIRFDSLFNDVGVDAVRWFALKSSIRSTSVVDLAELRDHSDQNPVYYTQYAATRLASIMRKAFAAGIQPPDPADADLSFLTHPSEREVMRGLDELPEVIVAASEAREPHRLTTWALEFAAKSNHFYRDCKVLADDIDPQLAQARLVLAQAVRTGFEVALDTIGVSVPLEMRREVTQTAAQGVVEGGSNSQHKLAKRAAPPIGR